jgi:hypothetical protein
VSKCRHGATTSSSEFSASSRGERGGRQATLTSFRIPRGSHLLHAPSPIDLVAGFGIELDVWGDDTVELGHAIVRARQSDGPLDALVHRTQVSRQR